MIPTDQENKTVVLMPPSLQLEIEKKQRQAALRQKLLAAAEEKHSRDRLRRRKLQDEMAKSIDNISEKHRHFVLSHKSNGQNAPTIVSSLHVDDAPWLQRRDIRRERKRRERKRKKLLKRIEEKKKHRARYRRRRQTQYDGDESDVYSSSSTEMEMPDFVRASSAESDGSLSSESGSEDSTVEDIAHDPKNRQRVHQSRQRPKRTSPERAKHHDLPLSSMPIEHPRGLKKGISHSLPQLHTQRPRKKMPAPPLNSPPAHAQLIIPARPRLPDLNSLQKRAEAENILFDAAIERYRSISLTASLSLPQSTRPRNSAGVAGTLENGTSHFTRLFPQNNAKRNKPGVQKSRKDRIMRHTLPGINELREKLSPMSPFKNWGFWVSQSPLSGSNTGELQSPLRHCYMPSSPKSHVSIEPITLPKLLSVGSAVSSRETKVKEDDHEESNTQQETPKARKTYRKSTLTVDTHFLDSCETGDAIMEIENRPTVWV
jgi:hypothetical protein